MNKEFPSFRALYHELEDYRGFNAYEDVLLPWLPNAHQAMAILSQLGDAAMHAWKEDDPNHPDPSNEGDANYWSSRQRLYALSRVNDLLLIPFEPRPSKPVQVYGLMPIAAVSAEEYRTWWQALGMTQIPESQPFHPFYHEIVTVEQSHDPDEPIQVIQTRWPGLMLGSMLFSRAGVQVRGGRNHILKEVAETSRLYWTFARKNRPTEDRSHGWGHNSQWDTDFRRDYVVDEGYYYNVDGKAPLFDADGQVTLDMWSEGLTGRSALEIMTHRCFISVEHNENEDALDPLLFDPTYHEPRIK